jgi:hypothetical protein
VPVRVLALHHHRVVAKVIPVRRRDRGTIVLTYKFVLPPGRYDISQPSMTAHPHSVVIRSGTVTTLNLASGMCIRQHNA